MVGLKAKALIGIGASFALIASGWQIRAWYEDSQDLSAERARQEVLSAVRASIASVGEKVESQLSEQVVKERIIDRGVIRETQKTVYRDRECFEPELVRLLNLGAEGGSADVSGELAPKVPGESAETE